MPQINLHDYQQVAKDFLIKTPKAGLFLDVGFGKTLTTLAALMEMASKGLISGHILVIAPKAIARSTWIDEMAKWGINASYKSLIVNERGKQLTKKKRIELYKDITSQPASFYFINKELITDLVAWHIDNKKPWPFPTVIVDELQSFKSYKSNRFKALKCVSSEIKRFIGLTGTPIPNGLMDLWSQVYLMDNGDRLGKNITTYRNTYFNPGLIVNNNVVSWWPKEGIEDVIYQRISDVVISVKNPNIKLPQVTYNNVYCYMSPDEETKYKELAKEQVLDIQNANGDDELNYVVVHNRKLEQLEYIINNTNSPVLVAYHFKSDKAQITKYLTDAGLDVKTFDGSPEMIHDWNDGKIPIMLLQPQSAGHGINIQDGGHTLVWYTLPWSLEEYIQTCGRLNRQGQKHPVVIHHLLTANTIDNKILNVIHAKDEAEKDLMNAVSAVIQDIIN